MEQAQKCRVCLQNTTQITFSMEDIAPFQQIPYAEVYKYVNTNCYERGGPRYFCWICTEDLLAAYEFKKRCERSEELFEKEISLMKTELDVETLETKVEVVEFDPTELLEDSVSENMIESNSNRRKNEKKKSPVKVESESEDQETFQVMSNDTASVIECPFCFLSVSSNSSRLKHCKLKHPEKRRNCTETNCTFKFFFPYQLSYHLTRTHAKCQPMIIIENQVQEVPALKCNDCSETFRRNSFLRKHRRTVHGIRDPYSKNLNKEMTICAHCGKVLSVSSLNSHMQNVHTNHDSSFICDLCGVRCKTRVLLVNHMKRRHLEQTTLYNCRYCPEIYRNYATRRTHEIRFHTKDFRHCCHICGMKFIENTGLKKHMVTHTGDKNHCCEQCNARFGTMSALMRHLQTHTDLKAFVCNVCQTAFKTSKSLKSHFNVHQERKYECPVCERKFLINQQMRQHVTRNHPEYELPPPGTVMNKTARERLDQINLKKMQLSLYKDS